MPWSNQDASGELAGMAIGASLWGSYNQTGEFGSNLTKPGTDRQPIRLRQSAAGCRAARFSIALARPACRSPTGKTSSSSTCSASASMTRPGRNSPPTTTTPLTPYVQGSYLNAKNAKYNPNNFINAALAGIGDGHNGGGPIWAIFDADAVTREKWDPTPPNVDIKAGFFFSADTSRRSRQQDQNAIPARSDAARNARADCRAIQLLRRFRRTTTISASRSRSTRSPSRRSMPHGRRRSCTTRVPGLRINAKCQVMDMNGNVIPGLYCGGESAGGFSQHGLARATCQGYIAGKNAASEAGAG